MSKLPKSMELDRAGIERLKVKEEVKQWLRQLVDKLEENYELIRDHLESGGYRTKHWQIVEDDDKNLRTQKRTDADSAWEDAAPKLEMSP